MSVQMREVWCPEGDLNPHRPFGPADFKSAASASFAIRAVSGCEAPSVSHSGKGLCDDAGQVVMRVFRYTARAWSLMRVRR